MQETERQRQRRNQVGTEEWSRQWQTGSWEWQCREKETRGEREQWWHRAGQVGSAEWWQSR
jgi:hypothetical protein